MEHNRIYSTYYVLRTKYSSKSGFSLLEIILFVGMFSAVIVAFLSMFVFISRVAVRNSAATEVATQSQFLLQTIQYNVERSSLIQMSADTPGSTLTLRMATTTEDATVIQLAGEAVTLTVAGGAAQVLTSDKVRVLDFAVTKKENPGGHDSVAVSFTMEYNTSNLERKFRHLVRTSVARVSAATFDSNVVPGGAYDLGSGAAQWRDGYFSSKVGIGVSAPQTPLHVAGGNVYVSDAGNGIVLKSSGGNCFLFTLSDAGRVATSSLACP